MSDKPTLVFVHGAGHNASVWDKVTSRLENQQYNCVRVALPSAASNPAATFLDDVTVVRNAILAETIQGRDVVIVVHSYGGAVGVSAIKGLTRPSQKGSTTTSANTQSGHVVGIVSMASGFGPSGLSFIDGLGGKPPPSWKPDEESGFAVFLAEPQELFYHDLPVEEGNYWTRQLGKQSLKSLYEGGEHAYAGWMDVPVWYLATTEDKALPVAAQKMMTQMVKDAGADITVREIASSHSPMLSKPEETVGFILEAVASFI
ncbi:hypothetical protein B7463_g10845, partial [Scytalidium lignicola]